MSVSHQQSSPPLKKSISDTEIECAVRNILSMPYAEQEFILRDLLQSVAAIAELDVRQGIEPTKTPSQSVHALMEDLRLSEQARRELELFPMKYRVGIDDDGSHFLRISVPDKVHVSVFSAAMVKLVNALSVDHCGKIIWRTPYFDPCDPATYVH